MKRFFVFVGLAFVALAVSSCFGKQESKFSQQYEISFEPGDPYMGISRNNFNSDSVYISSNGFYFSDIVSLSSETSEGKLLGGWAASMCKDRVTAEDHVSKDMAVFSGGGGVGGSRAFGVFYDSGSATLGPALKMYVPGTSTITQKLLYVNNTNAVVNSILYGKDKFGPGDYFLLTITGFSGELQIGQVEVYLADYRSDVPVIVREWKEVNLAPIASADSMKFSLKSTKEGTPRYVCVDDIVGQIEITY